MSYPIPTLDEQHRRILDLRRALLPGADVSEGGGFYRDDRVIALAIGDLHEHLDAVDRDSSPLTAEGPALDRWGAIVGVPRKGATTSARSGALQVRGTPASPITEGTALTTRGSGVRIEIAATLAIGADGTALADVRSIDKGTSANLPAGTTLDFDSPPAGVNQAAKLVLAMKDAVDQERDGAYRDRVVNRFQQPPQGGNPNDWVQWALLVAGVDAAYALRARNGRGTVDLVGLRNGMGAIRALPSAVRDEIASTVEALRPLSAAYRVLETTPETVSAEVLLTPLGSADFTFDWDDSAGLAVGAYDSNTRTVTTSSNLPDSLSAGDRIVFGLDGRVFLVAAILSSTQFTLGVIDEEDLSFEPTATDAIYAGGPLTAPVRAAILDGYSAADGTPIPGVNQLGPANEDAKYGGWIDTVEDARLAAAALSVPGVYRATVANLAIGGTPVVGGIARPSDPAVPGAVPAETTTIGVLVAGAVVVRRAP